VNTGSWVARRWPSTPWRQAASVALLPVLFVVATGLLVPFQRPLELDPDEGINASKALLVVRGAPIYGQEWNDQPPLFTHLLAVAVRLFGHHVVVGRWLVLLLAGLLLAAAAAGLRVAWNRGASLVAVALIWLLPTFPRLSVSVMIGVPALALVVVSWAALVRWHSGRGPLWLVASGAALGLSILTKGSSLLLLPLMMGGVLLSVLRRRDGQPRSWGALFAWTAALVLTLVVLSLAWVGAHNIGELIGPHSAARSTPVAFAAELSLGDLLRPGLPVLALAAAGATLAVRRRRWPLLYLAGWTLAAIAALGVHRPLWYHHALLATVPAALLAAVAVCEAAHALVRRDASRRHRLLAAGVLAVAGWFAAVRIARVPGELVAVGVVTAADRDVEAQVARAAARTRWLLTDRPLFGFESGLPAPPGLAVISQKRVAIGDLTEDDVLAAIDRWRPEQVLLCRFRLPRAEAALATSYRQVANVAGRRLYWRRDLLDTTY